MKWWLNSNKIEICFTKNEQRWGATEGFIRTVNNKSY